MLILKLTHFVLNYSCVWQLFCLFRDMFRLLICLPIFALIITTAHAQLCDQVLFSGKVLDPINSPSFYNLMIVNKNTGLGVFGQPNGHFSVYTTNGDTISISVKNYELITLVVVGDSNCQFKNTLTLKPKAKEMPEVVIRPLKSLEEIKEEREDLALRETKYVTGIDVLQSPITALYQTFSKKEQNKAWIAEQVYKDDQRRVVKELLRNYVSYDIIELNEDEFDDFISFLNINETFLKTATEMELITFIKDKFEHYSMYLKYGKD
jgi:hypothetical protein